MEQVKCSKVSHPKKSIFEVTSSLAFEYVLHSFLNIRNISQFPVDYIIKWYEIVLVYLFKKFEENRCFYFCFELRSEAAIAKSSGKYVFLECNNRISNSLKSRQNS